MTKIELVNIIAQTPGITKFDAQKIIQAFMSSITKALKNGEAVRLIGVGTFSSVKTPARMYRDINSGKSQKSKGEKSSQISMWDCLVRNDSITDCKKERPPPTSFCGAHSRWPLIFVDIF